LAFDYGIDGVRRDILQRFDGAVGPADLRWDHIGETIAEFNAALKLSPEDPDAKIGLGYVYLQQAKHTEAMELFRSVIATHPENGNVHYQLGKLLLDTVRFKKQWRNSRLLPAHFLTPIMCTVNCKVPIARTHAPRTQIENCRSIRNLKQKTGS